MAAQTLLIEGAWVLALDDAGSCGELGIAVRAGRIVELGPPEALRRSYGGAERFDATGTIALPGFINAHLHPEVQVLRGWLEGLDLHGWRRADRFNRARDLLGSPEGRVWQRAAVLASFADSLLHGVTTVGAYGVTAGGDEVAAEALAELGMHGHLTIRDVDFAPYDVVPAWNANPPRMYRLHAEEALTPSELAAAVEAALRGERIVMHAAETRARVRLARRFFGATTIRLLERHGLLSPRMLLSHAVHVDDEELELLARSGTCIVASPAAEMKLADGLAPVVEFLAAGLPVALGTDSAVCNNGNDLLLEARLLGLSQALRAGAGAIPALELLRCATVHGARVLGEDAGCGALVPGRRADIVLLDARTARLSVPRANAPAERVAADIVYSATGRDVRDVMVAGEWRVRAGTLAGADGERIWREAAAAADALEDALA